MCRFRFALVLPLVLTSTLPSSAQWNGPAEGRPCFGPCGPWAGPMMQRRFVQFGPEGRPYWGGSGFGPPRFGWWQRPMWWRRVAQWRRFNAWRRWAAIGQRRRDIADEQPARFQRGAWGYRQTAPVQAARVPVRSAPAPVQAARAPVRSAPAPVQAARAPVHGAPAPVQAARARVRSAPASVQAAAQVRPTWTVPAVAAKPESAVAMISPAPIRPAPRPLAVPRPVAAPRSAPAPRIVVTAAMIRPTPAFRHPPLVRAAWRPIALLHRAEPERPVAVPSVLHRPALPHPRLVTPAVARVPAASPVPTTAPTAPPAPAPAAPLGPAPAAASSDGPAAVTAEPSAPSSSAGDVPVAPLD